MISELWDVVVVPFPFTDLKIFTLDNRLILKKIGRLSPADRARVAKQIRRYLPVTQ